MPIPFVARRGYSAGVDMPRGNAYKWQHCVREARREIDCMLRGVAYVWRDCGDYPEPPRQSGVEPKPR